MGTNHCKWYKHLSNILTCFISFIQISVHQNLKHYIFSTNGSFFFINKIIIFVKMSWRLSWIHSFVIWDVDCREKCLFNRTHHYLLSLFVIDYVRIAPTFICTRGNIMFYSFSLSLYSESDNPVPQADSFCFLNVLFFVMWLSTLRWCSL